MQTTTLPIQANGPAPTPQRQNPAPNFDAGQFSAALSREIEQRQEAAPATAQAQAPQPQPQPKAAARHKEPQADSTPSAADAKATTQEPAKADDARPAAKIAKADADAGKDDAKAAEHPDTAHVTDMLALVASLKPLQNAVAAKAAGASASAGTSAGTAAIGATGKPGVEAAQLAALESAVKALGKDEPAQPGAKVFAAPDDAANPAAATPGAIVAADSGAGAKGAIDLRAFQEAAAGQVKAHPDAAPARELLADVAAMKEPAPAAQLLAQAQPVTLEVAQAAAAVAGDRIAARVGTPAWDNQVGQKIVWMAAGEEQSASLTLNPPDLGPLQVVLSVTNDQATVAFSSNQQEVRQALENALPRLREMMGESGIALGNASVNAGMPEQRQAHGGEQPRAGAAPSSRVDSGPAVAEVAARPVRRSAMLGDSGVDTFA